MLKGNEPFVVEQPSHVIGANIFDPLIRRTTQNHAEASNPLPQQNGSETKIIGRLK